MRLLALFLCVVPAVAFAQSAPPDDPPKGRIIDPFARMPHPRDKLRLPDPRTAAEKAAADGVVSPDAPPPTSSPPPASPPSTPTVAVSASAPAPAPSPGPAASRITPEPAATSASTGTFPTFRRSKTPLGVTTMRIKVKHDDTPPTPPRQGGSFEAGLGAGWIHLTSDYASLTSPRGTAGLSLGYGAWIGDDVALFLRAAAVAIPFSDGTLSEGYLGPTLQMWFTRTTWFGIGLGAGLLDVDFDGSGRDVQAWGPAGNLRVGHTLFQRSGHALDLSLELSPALFDVESGGDDATIVGTSIGLLVGYQLL